MGVYSTSGSGVDCTSQKEQIKMVWAAPRISTLEIHRTLGGGGFNSDIKGGPHKSIWREKK